MPLPPLPANNTDRAWLKYTAMGTEHELQLRFLSTTTQAAIAATLQSLAANLAAIVPVGDFFTGARHSDSGSNLSFPLPFTPVAGTGGAVAAADDEAKFISLVGRSLGGYRCRVTFFTPYVADSHLFRVTPAQNPNTQRFYDAIVNMADPAPRAVDGLTVVWNPYVNIGYNAYWQRQLRG